MCVAYSCLAGVEHTGRGGGRGFGTAGLIILLVVAVPLAEMDELYARLVELGAQPRHLVGIAQLLGLDHLARYVFKAAEAVGKAEVDAALSQIGAIFYILGFELLAFETVAMPADVRGSLAAVQPSPVRRTSCTMPTSSHRPISWPRSRMASTRSSSACSA